jgi:hypothetical protein
MKLGISQMGVVASNSRPTTICPTCGHRGVFETVMQHDVASQGYLLGIRRCPNEKCANYLFVIIRNSEVSQCYPALRIEFDSTNVPPTIVATLEEAITCHAENCYKAAAIMVRRTLEEICQDKNAAGNNLNQRLVKLADNMLIPKPLIEAMQELRLLGNDAAHIESQTFNQVGKQELDIALQCTKEILRAAYQYDDLLKKFKALKK